MISVEYVEEEKELVISGIDPDGNNLVLSVEEAMELHNALSDALPDGSDMVDDEDLDESADDDDDEYLED